MAFELEMFDGGWIVLRCVKCRVFAVEKYVWIAPSIVAVIAVSLVH